VGGCASTGNYVWYSAVPQSEWGVPANQYVIGAGDVININVYQQEGMSASLKVRRDGLVGLPLVGEVRAAGQTPFQLAREIEQRLKVFIVSPRVTVNVETSQPISVSTLGEVATRGTLTLEPPARLVQALSQAGGLAEYADHDKIFVLRQFPRFQRIRFTYEAILNNTAGAATFPLRTGDVIVVE
jgi:polysaccharide export outer membrane protein